MPTGSDVQPVKFGGDTSSYDPLESKDGFLDTTAGGLCLSGALLFTSGFMAYFVVWSFFGVWLAIVASCVGISGLFVLWGCLLLVH